MSGQDPRDVAAAWEQLDLDGRLVFNDLVFGHDGPVRDMVRQVARERGWSEE